MKLKKYNELFNPNDIADRMEDILDSCKDIFAYYIDDNISEVHDDSDNGGKIYIYFDLNKEISETKKFDIYYKSIQDRLSSVKELNSAILRLRDIHPEAVIEFSKEEENTLLLSVSLHDIVKGEFYTLSGNELTIDFHELKKKLGVNCDVRLFSDSMEFEFDSESQLKSNIEKLSSDFAELKIGDECLNVSNNTDINKKYYTKSKLRGYSRTNQHNVIDFYLNKKFTFI
jgi:hypothetical protein